jgi:ribosome-binding factor A
MTGHGSPRRYPRMARVNEVVRETLAEALERLSDPRIGLVTITGVDVSPDLRHASVYYSSLGPTGRRGGGVPVPTTIDDETRAATQDALTSAAPHLRAELGRQVRLKYVPELVFHEDPAIAQGERVEEIIRQLHAQDDT